MSSVPPRRRFRFALRTLFVLVTVAGVATSWAVVQWRWAEQRRAAIKWLGDQESSWYAPALGGKLSADAPWSLRMFGERGIVGIGMDVEQFSGPVPYSPEQLKHLFPEAIVDYSRDGRFVGPAVQAKSAASNR
jgi:hypothetical protein